MKRELSSRIGFLVIVAVVAVMIIPTQVFSAYLSLISGDSREVAKFDPPNHLLPTILLTGYFVGRFDRLHYV